jgi:hypothetical protein
MLAQRQCGILISSCNVTVGFFVTFGAQNLLRTYSYNLVRQGQPIALPDVFSLNELRAMGPALRFAAYYGG